MLNKQVCFFSTFVLALFNVLPSNCFLNYGPRELHKYEQANRNNDQIDSKPLILTPLLEAGKIKEAIEASQVNKLHGENLYTYSGFYTVNKTYNSNMFFWFFTSLNNRIDMPLLVWLQGGPGGSSLFGQFVENGPLKVNKSGGLEIRKTSWNQEFSLLYIDNPVGAGFSFTEDEKGYVTNESEVAENLYEALRQFFITYYPWQGQPLYLCGESYAGKYIPALAYKIHQMGDKAADDGFNLFGLAIGDGWCDPRNMLDYGPFLYQVGMVDETQRDHFVNKTNTIQEYIDKKEFSKATDLVRQLITGYGQESSYYRDSTGFDYYYNILMDQEPEEFAYYLKFLGSKENREALHVGNLTFGSNHVNVQLHMKNDFMDSVKPWIEELLKTEIRIMFYSGQLDVIVPVVGTENFLNKLDWPGKDSFKKAKKQMYHVEGTLAGYVRQTENMMHVIIRNAGHILPYDQPTVAYDMIRRFVKNQPFN